MVGPEASSRDGSELGSGPHPCFECERLLEWMEDLHIHHLDQNRQNDEVENLVVSCLACNNGWRTSATATPPGRPAS